MALTGLSTPARNPQGVDIGFCLFYFHLSYRRRLIRDVYSALILAPLTLFMCIEAEQHFRGHYRFYLLWTGYMLVFLASSLYNYRKWQILER